MAEEESGFDDDSDSCVESSGSSRIQGFHAFWNLESPGFFFLENSRTWKVLEIKA